MPKESSPPQRRLVLAWTRVSQRQVDLARLIGGEPLVVYPKVRFLALRYLVSTTLTFRAVRALKEGAVCVVSAPPVLAPFVATLAARRGVKVILDSHPGAFGLMGDRLSSVLAPLHRWSIRRAHAVLVTTPSLRERVAQLGGRGLVFHEPPLNHLGDAERPPTDRDVVLFPGTFARDEPIELVLQVANALPLVQFRITGDLSKAKDIDFPRNVSPTGWLNGDAFRREFDGASAVLVLSTERESVMRTAFEAVRSIRPLIVTDTEATRTYFPKSVHVSNEHSAVMGAIENVLALDDDQRRELALAAAEVDEASSVAQNGDLMRVLEL